MGRRAGTHKGQMYWSSTLYGPYKRQKLGGRAMNALYIKKNIPLAPYTIYKIGGAADFFAEVKNAVELEEAVEFARGQGLPIFVLGAGSNILVSDMGFRGLVIKMGLREINLAGGGKLVVGSGVSMARAVLESAKAGLTGFEWGIGVPGTIGGSVRGNAGCFGSDMSRVLESVRVLKIKNQKSKIKNTNQNSKFNLLELNNKECRFGYRDSVFKHNSDWIILSATLKLQKGDPKEIQEKIKRIIAERTQKQDIGTKTCGCIFKNVGWGRQDIKKEKLLAEFPELEKFKDQPSIPASFLIDQAGLKGKKVGKAFVSTKHANFFVNEGGATAEEVIMLIAIVKEKVFQKYGILLEEEIQYVGF